ncbi:MAG: hypothetical protein V4634_13585 [Pseudomonadota bacterium]
MSEDELYIADQIKTWVWSGFYDSREANEFLYDLLEGDVDEAMLRAFIEEEFEKKERSGESLAIAHRLRQA